MRFTFIILFTLLLCSVSAQVNYDSVYRYNEWTILKNFDSVQYERYDVYENTGSNVCPWQSVRMIGSVSIAINIVATYESLKVLWHDKAKISEDLTKFFNEYPAESLEVVQRGYPVELHRPGQVYPMPEKYDVLDSRQNLTKTDYFGWKFRIISGGMTGMNGIPVGCKRIADLNGEPRYIVSFAVFMKKNNF